MFPPLQVFSGVSELHRLVGETDGLALETRVPIAGVSAKD